MSIVLCVGTILILSIFVYTLRTMRPSGDDKPLIQVVVLGDIGHSPRMQYHALSLAETGKVKVELVGFSGSKPLPALVRNESVQIRYLRQIYIPPSLNVPFVVYAILKVLWESVQLFLVLLTSRNRSECMIVQTPPAIPSMLVCAIVAKLSGSRLVFDFHNITHMHLATKMPNKLIVGLVKLFESLMSRTAVASFCVTSCMKEYLKGSFQVSSPIYILYDKPGPQFNGRTSENVKNDLEHRLLALNVLRRPFNRYDFVLVSSTSWTADEDFGMVLRALPLYSEKTAGKKTLLFITGKGQLKQGFIDSFKELGLSNIDLTTAWLAPGDYPLLLGIADCGISVHTSTSGLDLPMKVVDMLGSETPVVALRFPALPELLGENGEGGLMFSSSEELAESLVQLTIGENAQETRERLVRFASKWRLQNWTIEWTRVVWPVTERFLPKRSRQGRRSTGV
jgi:beta-1,4-mannosyltransferase